MGDNLLLTASNDGVMRLWETRTGLCVETIKAWSTKSNQFSDFGHCYLLPSSKLGVVSSCLNSSIIIK